MEINFIFRLIKMTLFLAILASLFVYCYIDLSTSLGILSGACWACLNIYFLKMLLEEYLKLTSLNVLKFYTWIGIKFPLIYLTGYWLIKTQFFSVISLMSGFSLLFIAIFILGIAKIIFEKVKEKVGSSA
ncbi:hypothetical protein [Candidatus Protochlamydia sp. R18]|uniref:hypothetical protein n=1 Tax=Candidatus Protochlamydia sp. R18 TaxID=1353977 RepID=UPI0005A8CFDB|nr:hypothetical protein [Candidatus Protochlamydia sp. R18]